MGAPTESVIKYRFVSNRERRFGSNLGYVPALIENEVGDFVPALFTKAQLDEAIARARSNPEDAPVLSWWQSLFHKLL